MHQFCFLVRKLLKKKPFCCSSEYHQFLVLFDFRPRRARSEAMVGVFDCLYERIDDCRLRAGDVATAAKQNYAHV